MLLTACGGDVNSGSDSVPSDNNVVVVDPGQNNDVNGTAEITGALPVTSNNATFTSTHFAGSAVCASCHNGLNDAQGTDVSIESDWSTSLMANSARDPFWRAKLASEIKRNPQLETVLSDKCSRCHAPMANVEAKYDESTLALLGDGFLNPQNGYYDLLMDGVSCSVCHQIEDDGNLGSESSFSGNYRIVDLGGAERSAFAQYNDPRINPMLSNSGFRPKFGAHMASSALCATCHNLKTPFVDSSGALVSTTPETEFPEQMVYSEWENSVFASGSKASSCQDCHMPKTDAITIANKPKTLSARDQFARHSLLGANTAMLDILSNNKQALGVSANGFDSAIENTRSLLATAADIEVLSQSLSDIGTGPQLTVQLRINNRSGHKLPTSYPSRRAYIHFVVWDANGNIVFESGKTNPDGSITGVDADADLTRYEPHYDEITSPDQVQVYEAIMGDTESNITYTLLRGASYLKDNRIPPLGFDKAAVPDDIRVAGAASSDNNFNNGNDVITYTLPIAQLGAVSYSAELKYQSLAYGFIKDLLQDSDDPEVARFEKMYDKATIRSETLSSTGIVLVNPN